MKQEVGDEGEHKASADRRNSRRGTIKHDLRRCASPPLPPVPLSPRDSQRHCRQPVGGLSHPRGQQVRWRGGRGRGEEEGGGTRGGDKARESTVRSSVAAPGGGGGGDAAVLILDEATLKPQC